MTDQQIATVTTPDEVQQVVAFAANSTIEATPLSFEIEVASTEENQIVVARNTADATHSQGEHEPTFCCHQNGY